MLSNCNGVTLAAFLNHSNIALFASPSKAYVSAAPNAVAVWLALPLLIREVPGSFLGPLPAILTEVFHGVSQSLQAYTMIVI
jgi:hypothetical protein